jgi:Core-2/I-Branching enzyme
LIIIVIKNDDRTHKGSGGIGGFLVDPKVLISMSRHPLRVACFFLLAVLFLIERLAVQVRIVTVGIDYFERVQDGPLPVEKVIPLEHHSTKDDGNALPDFLAPYQRIIQRSDTVQLEHCLQMAWPQTLWDNFTQWAFPMLESKFTGNNKKLELLKNSTKQLVKDEFTMQLFEIYLGAHHTNLCNFSSYRFHRISPSDNHHKQETFERARRKLDIQVASLANAHDADSSVQVVFTIVAYRDAQHLEKLVKSIWMPQHLVILHIEQHSSVDFERAVRQLADQYPNVVVLQFGTIVYETDSVSQVNLEIMEWLHSTSWVYDYFVTLGGATFPLWNATALSQHLHNAKLEGKQVWMGELLHNSQKIHHPQALLVWNRKRLYTSLADGEKLNLRLGSIVSTPVPQWLDHAMYHKSVSGNQGVYSYSIVKRLLQHPQVKEVFALAKYGCCCCLEERTWIAAMNLLGFLDQAKDNYSMFQLWGAPTLKAADPSASASAACQGGMKNSVLEINMYPHPCYKSEHAYEYQQNALGNIVQDRTPFLMNATGVWERIVEAKSRGVLFARKFHSDNERSLLMLQRIVQELHQM